MAALLPRFFFHLLTFIKVEVQCAAIDGQARLEESAGGEAQRSSVIRLIEPLATTSNQRLGEQVI